MIFKSFYVFLLLISVQNIYGFSVNDYIDVSLYNSSYYDPATGLGLKGELEDSGREPLSSVKIAFRGLPCHCEHFTCSCCAGVNLTAIKFDRRACTNFTYDPSDFAIKMTMSMNEREIYANSMSAKNPPALCAPFAYFPLISFCVRFFDIYTVGRNFHTCIDFETRIVGSPILILHFNCIKVGTDGVSWLKPEDNSTVLQVKPEISEPEIYDEVDFEIQDLEFASNPTSTLSPEEEAQIGQLKL